jgi:hypothetical protein
MTAQQSLSRWISRLYLQVQKLEQKVKKARSKYDALMLEKEVNTRVSALESLYDFAQQHDVDVSKFHDRIESIKRTLKDIEVRLKNRKRPWWKKVLQAVRKAMPFIGPLLSFVATIFAPALGPYAEKIVGFLGDGVIGKTVRGLLTSGTDA